MTILLDIKKKKNLDTSQELFFNLLEELEIYEVKEKLVSLSRQLREITEDWHTSLEPEIPINEEEVIHLKKVINTYSDLVDEKRFKKNVMNTYLLDKPGSSIDIYISEPLRIKEFIKKLKIYFFVDFVISTLKNGKYIWTIYISRLKDINEIAVAYHHKYNGNHNFLCRWNWFSFRIHPKTKLALLQKGRFTRPSKMINNTIIKSLND